MDAESTTCRLAPSISPVCAHGSVMVGAILAVFLSAGVAQGSAGIFLICTGAALVVCPPTAKVDGRLWLAVAALLGGASLAFLPAHWFPVPGWRQALEALPIVPLPSTVTPVPSQTACWLAVLASAALTGLFALAQPIRSRTLLLLASVASLACGIYAALAILSKLWGWHYPFDGGATFGFFPNRNHTATFLVTGSILALGILRVTFRDHRWLLAALAAGELMLCVLSLLFWSASRGGIVFLLVGTLLWLAGLGSTHRPVRLLISCGAILGAGVVLFLSSGSVAQTRLAALIASAPTVPPASGNLPKTRPPSTVSEAAPADLRVLIYQDTVPMIRDFAITGTGLGTFAMVFPQYRDASLSEMEAVHPESDWLMLAAEAGVPTLLALAATIVLVFCRLAPLREHPYWPLRWGCVVAVATAALHGLVDVPAHHLSLGWWMLALAGLGFQPGRAQTIPRSRTQHAIFVLGGILMLILGGQLIRAEWFGGPSLPPFAAQRLEADIVRAYERQDIQEASRLTRQAIIASPMAEAFYYESGAFELPFAGSDPAVDAAFQAERVLEPGRAVVPFRQGEAWLHYDSAHATALWLDALFRRQRVERRAGRRQDAGLDFYRELLARATGWPGVQRGLLAAGNDHPAFALAWLEGARPELVAVPLSRFAKDPGFIEHLKADEQRRFLRVWYAAGDRAQLTAFIELHHDWQGATWPVLLRQWVDGRDFERAVHEVAAHYRISLVFPAPGQDNTVYGTTERERDDPVAAFLAYWQAGNTVAGRRLLDETANDQTHHVPPEIWRLKAADAAQQGNWSAAWQNLDRYLRSTRSDEFP